MLDVVVAIKADSRYPVNRKRIRQTIKDRLAKQRLSGSFSVSVSVVGDRKMRQLNRDYRQKDYPTDVLSFPTFDPEQDIEQYGFEYPDEVAYELGDIVVSYPQAVKIAADKNQPLDDVIDFLVDHSVLHLLGIHHD